MPRQDETETFLVDLDVGARIYRAQLSCTSLFVGLLRDRSSIYFFGLGRIAVCNLTYASYKCKDVHVEFPQTYGVEGTAL